MEGCTRRLVCLEKISPNNMTSCVSDLESNKQAVAHQQVTSRREVICPEPRRADRFPYIADSLNRLCCKPRSFSNLPTHRGDLSLDVFNTFFNKDDLEDDLDTSGQMGFFCGSPPVRANNPLIHDVQFVRQASTLASPGGNSHGGKSSSSRVERAPYCGASSFGGKPMVRIEGFTCGSSESHCVVPALA